MISQKLQAGRAFPDIRIPKLGGDWLQLARPSDPHDWKLVVVYRGAHCPLCTQYLRGLNGIVDELGTVGVDVVAVSADSAERATEQMSEVLPRFVVGHDLSVEQMHELGLYISEPRLGSGAQRPFAEPGLFVINDEGNLQIVDISNVPFARPDLNMVLRGSKFLRGLTEKFPVNGSFVPERVGPRRVVAQP